MSGVYGYEWSVDGRNAIQVPSSETEERGYIDCPRGTRAGKACMYLRSADAAFIVAAGTEVTIKCVVKKRDQADRWQIEKTVEWKGYIATECSAIDDSENCWVTFYDKRIHLERASIDRIFNSLFLMTWQSDGTTQYKFYDPDYCQAANVPYTFEEILDELFAMTTLTAPSLPVTPASPDNIHAHGSVADVLAGLLATQGCDLLFDPFTDELTVILLSDNQDTEAITEAQDEGRLVGNEVFTLADEDKHGKVEIWPRDWYPIRTVESDTATFGTGDRVICIRDHELANETTRKVLSARKTAISTACAAWFTAEGDLRDETYYGVIEQAPGEEIRQVQWWLPDETGYQSTRIINNAVPMPWIQRVENITPPSIRGSASSTGLGVTEPELFFYWASTEGEDYVNSGYYCKGIATTGAIGAGANLIAFATEHKWLAVSVSSGGMSGRRHWLGTLTLGYSGIVGGFWVTPATALDGELPSGNQWVVNLYKWDYGVAGAVVRVEQDGGRWIPLQQEYSCPPDEPPTEPLGSCNYYDPEVGSVCAIMTEAACALQSGGTWTEGGTCT